MVRSRVLSFISAFGSPHRSQSKNNPETESSTPASGKLAKFEKHGPQPDAPPARSPDLAGPVAPSADRSSTMRPSSMAFTYQPQLMDLAQDTLPELLPIFTFLNNHSNKLYQEGYFLKLNDLDTQGRPCADRHWVECFAQLVGTVLSLWDAASLDAAGPDGEVAPTFINLADASIKMIETLPTRIQDTKPLQNILSISTAGKNRYLLHFNSLHSLTQWTAGIRLSLFEHASLLEAYTGSIIAGKGKELNNIRQIMERCRFKQEDWARVRFGAGTPWRRCWCVVTPPDDKEIQKLQKSMKKRSAYDRTTPLVTGTIKFYDTKKTKKVQPIATITDAYSAYAIYPQSKPLIDQSTLVKIEGQISIHSSTQSTMEGFVFIMPEIHPAVSGFEIMLRFLFPVFDTFGLYGRPTRLIADTNNVKSLMFAFPKQKRYGYLDVLDVANLIHTSGSQNWSEKEWRKQLREASAHRMSTTDSPASSITDSRIRQRSSLPVRSGVTRFEEPGEPLASEFNQSADAIIESSSGTGGPQPPSSTVSYSHIRAASEASAFPRVHQQQQQKSYTPTRLSTEYNPLQPPSRTSGERPGTQGSNEATGSDNDVRPLEAPQAELIGPDLRPNSPPAPVAVPPAFLHDPREVPATRPLPSPELQRANNRMSSTTLAQLAEVGGMTGAAVASRFPEHIEEDDQSPQPDQTNQRNQPNPPAYDEYAAPARVTQGGPLDEAQETAPLVPVHGLTNLHIDTSRATKRKPLPSQPAYSSSEHGTESDQPPAVEPSLMDLRHTLDEATLDRVIARPASFIPDQLPNRDVTTEDSSDYDDESLSPDYASTRKSTDTKRSAASIPRPRMGVMKTVGDAPPKQEVTVGDTRYYTHEEAPKENPDIPSFDFGPTMAYLPTTRRPSMSDTLNNVGHGRTDSNLTARQDPATGFRSRRGPSQSPGREERRRSMIWQPGLATGRPDSPANRAMSPEEFVHQRTGSNPRVGSPVFLHRRNSSTPAAAGPRSGDWTQTTNYQASAARDLPSRPHSRGPASMLNPNDVSGHLSAREQEHVARMTGSTFFNLSSSNARPQTVGSGLIGAIDVREREKREMKDGVSNQMVQHAIAQRQQHQQQMYGTQQHYAPAHSVYNMPGANYTWDAVSTMHPMSRPRTSPSPQQWSGTASPQLTPAPPVAQQPTHYFQQYPNY